MPDIQFGKTKISIIIPVYNVKSFVERCVKSVINQTYQNLEVILVDDGSTDGSSELCDQMASIDTRIKVLHKENGGLSDARNAGMKVAVGEYIGFVDGDDWVEPTMYEKLVKGCLIHDCKVACCRYQEVFQDTMEAVDTAEKKSYDKESVCYPIHEAVEHYIKESKSPAIYHSAWSKLYHRSVIDGMQFIKGRKSEDIPFAGEVFSKIEKLAYVDEPLYDYNKIREGSIMNVKSMEHTFLHEIPGWKEEFQFFQESNRLRDLCDMAYFYFYWRILAYAKDCRKQKDQREMYDGLKRLLFTEKKAVKKSCMAQGINHKKAIRLKVFLFSPKIYWLLDGWRSR